MENYLLEIQRNKNSHLCMGLDIIPELLPVSISNRRDKYEYFLNSVIEITSEVASAFKINLAFFEALGSKGFQLIENIISRIPKSVIKIGDAKRGDIASTSKMYAKSLFEHFDFDAVTLNPFLGFDSLEPFFNYKNKFNFVLTLTSNNSASDFQKVKLQNGKPLYTKILSRVKKWNRIYKNLGIVFGATQKKEFAELNSSLKDLSILIPGIGPQGGDLKFVVTHLKKEKLQNFLINSSRGVLYENTQVSFQKSILRNAVVLKDKINDLYFN